MPTKLDDSIVFKDIKSRLVIELVDNIPTGNHFDQAQILIVLAPIYEIIASARSSGGLTQLVGYIETNNYSDLFQQYDKLPQTCRDQAIIAANKIIQSYNLTNDWLTAFYIAILTNHLPVPPESQIVMYPSPLSKENSSEILKIRKELAAESDSVLIEIPRKASLYQLRSFITNNSDSLKIELDKLSGHKPVKRESQVMFWGWATAIIIHNNPSLEWPQVLAEQRAIRKQMKQAPTLPETPDELRKTYERYLETLNKF